MITCGRCKSKHASADEVRDCYAGRQTTVIDYDVTVTKTGLPAFATDPATDKQIKFIKDLSEQKDSDKLHISAIDTWMNVMDGKPISKREASELITAFGQLPVTKHKDDPWQMVPEGKFALKGNDGVTQFYEVVKPRHGKWAGQTWVALLTGSPGDWNRSPIGRKRSDQVLSKIAADPMSAARLFGDKWCICGRCSSPLSNVRSRAAGYGEVCASKMYWPYPSRAEAMRMLRERGVEMPSDCDIELLEAAKVRDEQAIVDSTPEWTI